MFTLNKKQNKKSGFTLIEMLVAVLIFTLSLTALMSISAQGLKLARNADKQLVADYLAIEAMEVVRNTRDNALLRNAGNGVDGTVWEEEVFYGDGDCTNASIICNFYINSSGEIVMDSCDDCTVFISVDQIRFFQTLNDTTPATSVGIDSGYQRYISIRNVTPGQVKVVVRVKWGTGQVAYTENLFLWQ